MRTVVIDEPGKVEIREIEKPIPKKGEALLRILYGGICGSDIGTYKGTFLYSSYPRIPGHEFSAEVVEVGENDYGISKGMIVTANPYFNCGTCYSCERDFVNCCEHNETLGAQRDGIFREYYTMPVERIYDGKGMDSKTLAMIEPFCISYHAVKRAKVKKGERVLIIGAGTIGLLAALAAKGEGASVYVSDLQESRLNIAKKLGAIDTILTSKENFEDRVKEITNNKGFDVCIECVGLPVTFQNCVDAVAFRGRVVVVGIGKQSLDFAYTKIQTKEIDIYGSRNAIKEDFIELIDRVNAGEFNLEPLLTGEYGIEETEEAFAQVSANPDKMLKVLVKIGD